MDQDLLEEAKVLNRNVQIIHYYKILLYEKVSLKYHIYYNKQIFKEDKKLMREFLLQFVFNL